MKYNLVVSVMAVLLTACGGSGSNPIGPSAPATSAPNGTQSTGTSSTFCLVDDMAQPLTSATIGLVSGEVISVVDNGCIGLPAGAAVAYAEAPGFRRLTDFPMVREDVALPQGTFALWPTNGYLEQLEEYDGTYSQIGTPFGGVRPRSGVYTLALPSQVASTAGYDPGDYRAALSTIMADASADTSNKITFSSASSGSANIQVVEDPTLSPFMASLTVTAYSGGFISGGVLKLRSLDLLINEPGLIRHELGHFSGINHSNDTPQRLMYRSPQEHATSTDAEIIHLRMRYLRPNRFDSRKG